MSISTAYATLPMSIVTSPAGDGNAARLLIMAQQVRSPSTSWSHDMDWTRAHNAHRTNEVREMAQAIRSDANWFEGDVRVGPGGVPVMQHDPHDEAPRLTLEEWLAIGVTSGRGLKVELKEPAVFDAAVAAIERSGIEQSKLILNVPVAPVDPANGLSDEQLRELRRRFPHATINLSPTNQSQYSSKVIAELARTARLVGGRVMFPLEWSLVTDAVIGALRPFGKIAVWSSVWSGTPHDAVVATKHLRDRGVDGMVDLARAGGGERLVAAIARSVGGWLGRPGEIRVGEALHTIGDDLLRLLRG
ncbi:MAG: DUF2181 domain-containing protein [Thermoleophilia bacterium]|nr:DUF2181 domain-containing protein [Thermoleophilia bacterium]